MSPFLADECCHAPLLDGIVRFCRGIDLVNCQETGLLGSSDSDILRWAIDHGRMVLTHDKSTMIKHWAHLLSSRMHIPGLVVVHEPYSYRRVIGEVCRIAQGSRGEYWNQIVHLR